MKRHFTNLLVTLAILATTLLRAEGIPCLVNDAGKPAPAAMSCSHCAPKASADCPCIRAGAKVRDAAVTAGITLWAPDLGELPLSSSFTREPQLEMPVRWPDSPRAPPELERLPYGLRAPPLSVV